jgi:hypothetical protein
MKIWIAIAVDLALGVGALAGGAGCKEDVGEHCQVDADCSSGLVCNQAQQVCATPGSSGGIDATVEPPMDAATPDATIDAATDATP